MPRLLTLLPCEKVLFGENQTVSLIIVLSEIHFRIFINTPAPPVGSAVSYNWTIFTQWDILPTEASEKWEQSISLASLDGQTILVNVAQFQSGPQVRTHRMIGSLNMMPIIPEGEYEFIASYKKAEETSWQEGGRYPIRVIYDRISVPIETPVTTSTP